MSLIFTVQRMCMGVMNGHVAGVAVEPVDGTLGRIIVTAIHKLLEDWRDCLVMSASIDIPRFVHVPEIAREVRLLSSRPVIERRMIALRSRRVAGIRMIEDIPELPALNKLLVKPARVEQYGGGSKARGWKEGLHVVLSFC